jgi:hypothetical protein
MKSIAEMELLFKVVLQRRGGDLLRKEVLLVEEEGDG